MILIVFYYLLFFISIGINEDGYDYDFYFDEERDYRGTPFKIRQEDTFFDNIFFDNQKYFFSESGISFEYDGIIIANADKLATADHLLPEDRVVQGCKDMSYFIHILLCQIKTASSKNK